MAKKIETRKTHKDMTEADYVEKAKKSAGRAWEAMSDAQKKKLIAALKVSQKREDMMSDVNKDMRKKEDARKYRLGGILVRSGLENLLGSEPAILGGLLALGREIAKNPDLKVSFQAAGAAAFMADKAEKNKVSGLTLVAFSRNPGTEVTDALKAANGSFRDMCWHMPISVAEIEELLRSVGNDTEVTITPPESAEKAAA